MKKRILTLLLMIIMVIGLAACSKEEKITNLASKEGVFKVEDLKLDLGIENINHMNFNQIAMVGDTIYCVVYAGFHNGNAQYYVTMDTSGNVLSKTVLFENIWENTTADEGIAVMPLASAATAETAVVLPMPEVEPEEGTEGENGEEVSYEEYTNNQAYHILDDGRLVYVNTYEKVDSITWEQIENKIHLIICDTAGQEVSRILFEPKLEEGQWFYVNTLIPGPNQHLYAMCDGFYFDIDLATGTMVQKEGNQLTNNIYGANFYRNGYPVVSQWDQNYTKQTYVAVDLSTGTVVEELTVPDNLMNYNIYSGEGSGYDLILTNSAGVYGYTLGSAEPVLIMDMVNSDLGTYGIYSVQFTDKDHFVGTYNDFVGGDQLIAKFTKVAPEDVPDKEGLTLAVYYMNTNITKEVIKFNKASEKYRILIKDYSIYATNEDWLAGVTQLNNEIISNKVPDIIVADGNIPVDNYANKGVLLDFYKLIEKDETIHLEDYCTNVFEAFEIDEKLYQLPYKFYVQTFMGKESIFGTEAKLTWDQLDRIQAQYPEAKILSTLTKENVLSIAMQFNYNQLVNTVTGECNFNSDTFKKILEFANDFPEEIDWEKLYEDNNYWMEQETQYIDDRTLLSQIYVSSLYNGWIAEQRNFLEEATPVGFPTTEGGQGSIITTDYSFAISAKSAATEGAWEFVKTFISPEYQNVDEESMRYSSGLPVLKEALVKSGEAIKQKPYYTDENGNKVEYDETLWINNEEVVLEVGTDADVQKWVDFVCSVNQRGSNNYSKAMEIISEEAAAYFSGQKSVDDVAGIIQSRMFVFVNEDL